MNFLKNIGKEVSNGAIATVGGAVARVAVNNMDKLPFVGNMKIAHKPIAFLLGAAFAGNKSTHYAGVGAMAVAGTDFISDYVPMVKAIGGVSIEELDALADELAEDLELEMSDDVSNSEAAMNDDVSNSEAAMNAV